MNRFYVTGGTQHKDASPEVDWFSYKMGRIVSFTPSGQVETCRIYSSPQEVRPRDDRANIVFKSGSLQGDQLVVCTQTEVLFFSLPDFRIERTINHPWLNDAHHACVDSRGHTLVANTGLDQVLDFAPDGELAAEWNTYPDVETWSRFDRDTDYRKVITTKPHLSHPNFVLEYDSQLWVTRFKQRDLYCLTDPSRSIEVSGHRVHDGNPSGDLVYMTAVEGHVLICDMKKGKLIANHDLNTMTETDKVLGWCRGLHILDENRVLVGFSRLRGSRVRDNLQWLKHKVGLRETAGRMPTRVACYDLKAGILEWQVDLEPEGMNAVFSILPASSD